MTTRFVPLVLLLPLVGCRDDPGQRDPDDGVGDGDGDPGDGDPGDGDPGDGDPGDGDDGDGDGDDQKPDLSSPDPDPAGTCFGFCGGVGSSENCYCDPACAGLDDCCPDYEDACAGGCLYNSDCAGFEVCSPSAGQCVAAIPASYTVYVYWEDNTDTCFDGLGEGNCAADLYVEVEYGIETIFSSAIYVDVVQQSVDFAFSIEVESNLSLAFYDDDVFSDDDFLNEVCACPTLSPQLLHDGYLEWNDGSFFVSAYFAPW